MAHHPDDGQLLSETQQGQEEGHPRCVDVWRFHRGDLCDARTGKMCIRDSNSFGQKLIRIYNQKGIFCV